jgi:hypothetical protein
MAVVVGGEHWQSRAKRAAASAAAPSHASADRALLPCVGKLNSKQPEKKIGVFFETDLRAEQDHPEQVFF